MSNLHKTKTKNKKTRHHQKYQRTIKNNKREKGEPLII